MNQILKAMKKPYLILLSLTLCIYACEKNNDTGDDKLNNITDISGFWIANQTISGNCSDEEYPTHKIAIYKVQQSDSVLKFITYPNGDTADGLIQGYQITWENEFYDGYGTNTINFSGVVDVSGNSISGTADWTWQSGTYSCSGSSIIAADKAAEQTVDFEGSWTGNWVSEEYDDMDGTFTVNITQEGNTLSGTISVPSIFEGEVALSGEVHGNVVYFGDVNGEIVFTGIINNNASNGTYEYPYYDDEGGWEASRQLVN